MLKEYSAGKRDEKDLDRAGALDPRAAYRWLRDAGFPAWLDVAELGDGEPLFGQLVEALKQAAVVVAFVSDEYSRSANCRKEWYFAKTELGLPVIPVIVGSHPTPGKKPEWRLSEIGFDMGNLLYIDARNANDVETIKGQILRAVSKYTSQITDALTIESKSESSTLLDAIRKNTPDDCKKWLEKLSTGAAQIAALTEKDPYDHSTPIHVAAALGYNLVISAILSVLNNGNQSLSYLLETKDASGATPVFLAASNGHTGAVKTLLKFGANASAENRDLRTPLHAASGYGHTDIVRELLLSGAVVDAKDEDGVSPVFFCARTPPSCLDCAHLLVGPVGKANPDLRDWWGRTPVAAAVRTRRNDVLLVLLEANANPSILDVKGYSPLAVAAEVGNADAIRLLIKYGARPDEGGKGANAPVHVAVRSEQLEALQALLDGGAGTEVEDSGYCTPIIVAAREGFTKVVQLLINKGANVNHYPNGDGFNGTAIYYAAYHNHIEVARLILSQSGVDLELAYSDGQTPLIVAAERGHAGMVELLLAAGANPNATTKDGEDFLYFAAFGGLNQVVLRAIEQEPQLLNRKDTGNTLLHSAVSGYHLGLVQALVAKGADVNARNNEAKTSLHLIADVWRGSRMDKTDGIKEDGIEICKALLYAGAEVDVASESGFRAIQYAALMGKQDIVGVLLDAGADPRVVDGEGRSLFDLCIVGSCYTILDRLLLSGVAQCDIVNERGYRPLFTATSMTTDVSVFRVLLKHGADVNAKNGPGAQGGDDRFETALHNAARLGKVEIVKALLEAGADPNAIDNNGRTPLFTLGESSWNRVADGVKPLIVDALVRAGGKVDVEDKEGVQAMDLLMEIRPYDPQSSPADRLAMVRIFLSHGASVGRANKQGQTLVISGSAAGLKDIVELAIEGGAEISAVDFDGATALHHATKACAIDVMQLLLSKGANVEAREWKAGETPLHRVPVSASRSWGGKTPEECVAATKLLLEAGADASAAVISHGWTLLHDAVSAGSSGGGVVELLLRAGADVNAVNTLGWTPLLLAAKSEVPSYVKRLLDLGARMDAVENSDGHTAAHCAISYRRIENLSLLLDNGHPLEIKDKLGRTPLCLAAEYGWAVGCRVLIAAGASCQASTDVGLTPLLLAAKRGSKECVEVLLERGSSRTERGKKGETFANSCAEGGLVDYVKGMPTSDLNAKTEDGKSLAMFASMSDKLATRGGRLEIISWIGDLNPQALRERDNCGRSAIHHAAGSNELDIVKKLVELSADVNEPDIEGCTPLILAAGHSEPELALALLELGADASVVTSDGTSALLRLCSDGCQGDECIDLAQRLLEGNCDPNISSNSTGSTSLIAVAKDSKQRENLLSVILAATGDEALNATDKDGRSALWYATSWGQGSSLIARGANPTQSDHRKIAPVHMTSEHRVLVEAGADLDITTEDGWCVLHLSRSAQTVQLVLDSKHGGSVDARDARGRTPLHTLCGGEDVDFVGLRFDLEKSARIMLGAGADVHATDISGRTPLFYAVGNKQVVEILIKSGADINATDLNGDTVLHFLAKLKKYNERFMCEIAAHLYRIGVDFHVKNKMGESAAEHARKEGRKGLAALLEFMVQNSAV
ncbi:ankyrin repeat-containing domain protein [Cladochytrium replicatum]|nr:ankyrin repeat-containing domain protein [Cladochytrium replicatum]